MLTFLHLSDIHFRDRERGSQFDLDEQLRGPMLADIKSKPADGAGYDGMLITGDIAFGGKKEEYDRAKLWLEQIYAETGVLPENTYVIPGNHDVDRDKIPPGGGIWNNQAALRSEKDKTIRQDLLHTQLTRDPVCNPLAPLEAYNEFAQGYECRTEKENLAWVHIFPKTLNDGSRLRIHGLNSALNSNKGDEIGNLYVSPFQRQHFRRDNSITELVLCHHPPRWLLDATDIENSLRSYVRAALFGHEHSHLSQTVNQTVQLFAGAVHPAARDPDWLPTYHILQLKVEGTGTNRQLVVRIHSREFRAAGHVFVRRNAESGVNFEEYKVALPEWDPAPAIPVAPPPVPVVSSGSVIMTAVSQPTSTPSPVAFRELLVHFHRLSTPVRYTIATKLELLRNGDDLPPQQQWDLVFKRAREENRLAELWAEIASKDPAFAKRPNPFTKS